MKQGFIRCVIAALFAAAAGVSAGAGEAQARSLPDGIAAHFSFAAPRQFMTSLFEYTTAAGEETTLRIPPVAQRMTEDLLLPVSFDAWDGDHELHVVLVGDYSDADVVVVFSYDTFDVLLNGMLKNGWRLGDVIKCEPPLLPNAYSVSMREIGPMILAFLDGGRAVLARDVETALRVVDNPDWTPTHDSDADFVARTRVDGGFGARTGVLSGRIGKELAGKAGDILDVAVTAGLTAEAAVWIATAAMDYGRAFGDELEQARDAELTLDFDGGQLVAELSARFADGSRLRRLAETAGTGSEEDFPGGALLARLPEGFFSGGAAASLAGFAPDAEAVLSRLAELAPERKDKLPGYGRAFFAAGPGAAAQAAYLNNGAPYQVFLCAFDDAQAALDAVAGMGGIFSGMVEGVFMAPEEAVSLPMETLSAGGREWLSWRIAPADEAGFAAFLERLNSKAPSREFGLRFDPGFRIHAARTENPEALVLAAGTLGAEEFAALLRRIDAGGAASIPGATETAPAAEGMGAAQFLRGTIKPAQLYLYFALEYAARTGREFSPLIFEETKRTGTDAFFSLGAEDGRVAARLALPVSAVRAAVLMHDMVRRLSRQRPAQAEPQADEQKTAE